MANRIRRPRRRFYTAGVRNPRFLWWWAQQRDTTIPGAGFWFDSYTWQDSDRYRD